MTSSLSLTQAEVWTRLPPLCSATVSVINRRRRRDSHLLHAGVVQEREQRSAVAVGGRLVVHHGHLDPSWVSAHTQADQGDLDDGQQELETQGAAEGEEKLSGALGPGSGVPGRSGPPSPTYPGILLIRTIVLMVRAAMFLSFGSRCLARTFQSAEGRRLFHSVTHI